MIKPFDEKRELAIFEDIVEFACTYFLTIAKAAIEKNGLFSVALAGGSTPKALYNKLKEHKDSIDWGKVYVFFSDERSVPPSDPESNYHMAITNGFSDLPIPKEQIFRMKAETNIEQNAKAYEMEICKIVKDQSLDLILLGIGDDGHTASLFPNTKALEEKDALVVKNHIPQKDTDRMTFTYPLLERAKHILFLVTGAAKAEIVKSILTDKSGKYPAKKVSSNHNKVLWALDKESSSSL